MATEKPFTDLGFRGTTWYLASEVDEKLEAIRTWLKDAPEPMFLEPGRSPFISETSMEVWMEKCPLQILEASG